MMNNRLIDGVQRPQKFHVMLMKHFVQCLCKKINKILKDLLKMYELLLCDTVHQHWCKVIMI